MYKSYLKSIWTVLFMSMMLVVSAQEICDNGIDDDGDSLVDLNDDECGCADTMPLTSVTGSICRNNLDLTLDQPGATSYQWYKDGIAVSGETGSTIRLSDFIDDVEGDYEVVATTATGCVISEAYEVTIPEYENYLGEEFICEGDTFEFGPFKITREGFVEYKTTAMADGCDSLVSIYVYVTQHDAYFVTETHCLGTCVEFGDQTICDPGQYEHTFPSMAGCDSIVKKTLIFEPLEPINISASICRGDNYVFRDIDESEPGEYSSISTGPEGCDTVYLVDLEVVEPVYSEINGEFCAGGNYEYEGETYDSAGTYDVTFMAASGCDSIVTLMLMELPTDEYTKDISICQGKVFTYGDITADEAGQYITTITSGPCDSLVTVNLTVIDPAPAVEEVTICDGEVFTWNGEDYDTEGEYDFLEETDGDCDILHRLTLKVTEAQTETLSESICAGGSVEVGGMTFMEAGDFEIELEAASGCDSLIILTVTEDDVTSYTRTATICQGMTYEFNDISATESGAYETLIETDGACDSLIVVELTVTEPEVMLITETICEGVSFEWQGQEYTETGMHELLETGNGSCDVLHQLELTVLPPDPIIFRQTICQGQNYEWNGEVYSTPGFYEHMQVVDGDCDELYQLELMVTAPEVVVDVMSLCPSELPFEFGDLKVDETGVYNTTVSGADDCDIEYQFDITVLVDSESQKDVIICDGDTYTEYGLDVTTSGTYPVVIPNAAGCDSLITVEVLAQAVAPATQEDVMVCPGESFIFHGETITEEGETTVVLANQYGCDSLVTLTLAYNDQLEFQEEHSICEGESLDVYGVSLTDEDMHEVFLSSGSGCDSLIMIDLKVLQHTLYEMDATICDGETFTMDGIVGTETDTYITSMPNAAGCDSTIIVNLTVVSHEPSTFDMEICEGDVYTYDGQEYDAAGTYPAMFTSSEGCDSLVSLNLSVLPLGQRTEEVLICPGDEYTYEDIFATEAGTYQTTISNAVGCDSVITIILELDDIDAALDLGDDLLINIGSSVDIIPEYVSGALNGFEWTDEDGNVIGSSQELFDYNPLEDTYVELYAYNDNGCEVRERIDIDVELIVDIYLPNVISLEFEGADHHFTPGANESVVGIQELYIYDRYGELMFTDDHDGNLDSYLGWDGMFKNKEVLGGVYTYYIIFEIIDGTTVKKAGSFTVLL